MAFFIKRNDTRPLLELHLTADGAALDLTTADSAKLLMKSGALTHSIPLAITDPTGGIVLATFSAAETADAATFDAEVEITWNPGEIETVPNDGYFQIVVKEDLG